MNDLRFSIIPGWIVTDPRLKGRDLQVLCLLGRHIDKAGWCFRSQVKMAKQLACARSTIQASLDRLMNIGVVERRAGDSYDGRDTSYHYRVIFDRDVAASTMQEWEMSEAHEAPIEDAETGCRSAGTPADIPAPPADPESAPPADPGSAPYKNVPDLTPPAEQEREARACDEGEGQRDDHGRRSGRRSFRKGFRQWPTYIHDSEDEAWKEFCRLGPSEQAEGLERQDEFIAKVRETGRSKFRAYSAYWAERQWQKLPPKTSAPVGSAVIKPFGKMFGATLYWRLLKPSGPLPRASQFLENLMAQDTPAGKRERRAHQARHGWPEVNAMLRNAASGTVVTIRPELILVLESVAPGLEQVKVSSDRWEEWRHEHERRGWPWMPDPGKQEWVYFPAGGPAGLGEFQVAVKANEDKANDGGTAQAAE